MTDLPTITDFAGPDELLIRITEGKELDDLGRVQFTVFWPNENTPSGVRGQVFFTDLEAFVAREAVENRRARVIA